MHVETAVARTGGDDHGPTRDLTEVHKRDDVEAVLEAEARCVVVARRADEFTASCDVALIDPDGSPRVELLGVQLVRRPG